MNENEFLCKRIKEQEVYIEEITQQADSTRKEEVLISAYQMLKYLLLKLFNNNIIT